MPLTNQAVLITGATRRLGLAFAQEALALGLDVVAHYRRSAGALRRWLRCRPAFAARVQFLRADLESHRAPELMTEALRLAPRLCGLVNNAAVFETGDLRCPDHLRFLIETNAFTPYALGTAFYHTVRKGWIVNVTDARVTAPNLTYQNYRISKLLLERLTCQQALLYAPEVRVNAIAPGAILRAPRTTPAAFRTLIRRIPLGNGGLVDDIRRAFAYLVAARSVTGQVLYVDGGWHIAP